MPHSAHHRATTFPATDRAKHPVFSTNHVTYTNKTKHNYNQEQNGKT